MNQKKILILAPLKFYAPEDEELFFSWLDKIACVESYAGVGQELHLVIAQRPITFNEYRNFNGLFKRYKLKNSEQLEKLFYTEETKDWF
jgi:hypothetical protein